MLPCIVHRYLNEFISENELIKEILELKDLTNKEREDINELINKINTILKDTNSDMIRFSKIYDLLISNETYQEQAKSMNIEELMLMIVSCIQAKCVPSISQEVFDQLVEEAKKDENSKEWCWRLAMNYCNEGMDLSNIEDYFISTYDAYFICEYISTLDHINDINELINKIIRTDNKKFVETK